MGAGGGLSFRVRTTGTFSCGFLFRAASAARWLELLSGNRCLNFSHSFARRFGSIGVRHVYWTCYRGVSSEDEREDSQTDPDARSEFHMV